MLPSIPIDSSFFKGHLTLVMETHAHMFHNDDIPVIDRVERIPLNDGRCIDIFSCRVCKRNIFLFCQFPYTNMRRLKSLSK